MIISNFQGREFLQKCLTHLVNQSYENYEVIFVDAGSTDGSIEFVKENFPEVVLIECNRVGIGEAINIGIKRMSGDIISFDFNTDEYVLPNWMNELVNHLKIHNFDIIAGTTRIIHGTSLIDEAGVNINFLGHGQKLGNKKEVSTYRFSEQPVSYVGSPTFHKKILKKTGLVDEGYFIYAEDMDFCYRASLLGIRSYNAPLARSFHEISSTTKRNIERYEYFLRRAQIRFQLIYFSSFRLSFSLLYMIWFVTCFSLIQSIFNREKQRDFAQKLRGQLRAIGWNITNLRSTIIRRKQINALRIRNERSSKG